jgi:hypothetical protein
MSGALVHIVGAPRTVSHGPRAGRPWLQDGIVGSPLCRSTSVVVRRGVDAGEATAEEARDRVGDSVTFGGARWFPDASLGPMHYRVTQWFDMIGDAPSEAAVDHLLAQLVTAAPDAGALVALALGRGQMEVTMAFEADSAAGAVALAETATAAAVADGAAARALAETAAAALVDDGAAALALVESGAVAVLGDAPVSVLVERLAGPLTAAIGGSSS